MAANLQSMCQYWKKFDLPQLQVRYKLIVVVAKVAYPNFSYQYEILKCIMAIVIAYDANY